MQYILIKISSTKKKKKELIEKMDVLITIVVFSVFLML